MQAEEHSPMEQWCRGPSARKRWTQASAGVTVEEGQSCQLCQNAPVGAPSV